MILPPITAGEPPVLAGDDRPDAPEGAFLALLVSQVADPQPLPAAPVDVGDASEGTEDEPAAEEVHALPADVQRRGHGVDTAPVHRVDRLPAAGRESAVHRDLAGPVDVVAPGQGRGAPQADELVSEVHPDHPRVDLPQVDARGGRRLQVPGVGEVSHPRAAVGASRGLDIAAVASVERAGQAAPAVLGVLRDSVHAGAVSPGMVDRPGLVDRVPDTNMALSAVVDVVSEVRSGQVSTDMARTVDPAVLDRVLRAVEALEQAPPPRQMSIEVEGIRLTIGLQGDEVRVVVRAGADQLGSGWDRELGGLLREQGFDLAADTGSGRGASQDRDERSDAAPPRAGDHDALRARPAHSTDDLRL